MENKDCCNENFMVKNKLEKINNTSLPNGYRFTNFRTEDENGWAYIQYKAGNFKDYQIAIRTIFKIEKLFGKEFNKRCLFLENEFGERIGTVMILPSDSEDNIQEIKYLAVIPRCQGKGFGKALMAKTYNIINGIEGINRINLELNGNRSKGFFEGLGFENLTKENII